MSIAEESIRANAIRFAELTSISVACAQLPMAEAVRAYRAFLKNYAKLPEEIFAETKHEYRNIVIDFSQRRSCDNGDFERMEALADEVLNNYPE